MLKKAKLETSRSISSSGTQPSHTANEPQSPEAKLPDSQQLLEPRFVTANDFFRTYANHVYFKPSTIWDMSIIFGEIGRDGDGKLTVENRVSVTMPVAVAKLLALGIEANLEQYKKTTGKDIDLPPVVLTEIPGGPLVPVATVKGPTEKK